MASRARIAAERRGRWGEWLAALCLQMKGYRILARRYRCPQGEIDLIARRGDTFAFIEVKARPTPRGAIEAVSQRAWQRISASAGVWAARAMPPGDWGWRYDVIAICPRRWPVHMRDAWRPDFAL